MVSDRRLQGIFSTCEADAGVNRFRRYSWWKAYFPDEVTALSGVSRGFRKGLDLMNQAMALGDDAQYRYVTLLTFSADGR